MKAKSPVCLLMVPLHSTVDRSKIGLVGHEYMCSFLGAARDAIPEAPCILCLEYGTLTFPTPDS
jgi:hypothetical protein